MKTSKTPRRISPEIVAITIAALSTLTAMFKALTAFAPLLGLHH